MAQLHPPEDGNQTQSDSVRWFDTKEAKGLGAQVSISTTIDLANLLRPGDTIAWGQASAEPRALTSLALSKDLGIRGLRCLVGFSLIDNLAPEDVDHLTFLSYCGTGANAQLHADGLLSILPIPYSQLEAAIEHGPARVDVLLLQVPPPDSNGRFSLGLAVEYLLAARRTARVVIGQVNDLVPRTRGPATLGVEDFTALVRIDEPPATAPPVPQSEAVQRLARNVAQLVEDGATLQVGMGAVPDAIVAELGGHRGLGIHSGLMTDALADLIRCGAVTNEQKTVKPGISIAGLIAGGRELFDLAHENPRIELHPTSFTHDPGVLAALPRFTALNSALEVDLTGQVNSEIARSRYVGAVGGAGDYLRGAQRSPGGLPIIALSSTASGHSRIVSTLSGPVSTSRSDAGVIVTEHGAADLRHATLETRIERMISIADPGVRQRLGEEAEKTLRLTRGRRG